MARTPTIDVFISYAREDLSAVAPIHFLLQLAGYRPWLDKVNMVAGKDWELTIQQTIQRSHFVVICLSTNSVSKEGFVQAEIRAALEAAQRIPENQIFIIPVRLDDCDVPFSLQKYDRVDLHKPNGMARLLEAIETGRRERQLFSRAEEAAHRLLRWILKWGTELRSRTHGFAFDYRGQSLECLFDPHADRMRFVCPLSAQPTSEQDIAHLLRQEPRTACEGRYGLEGSTVFATFLHPLTDLSEAQCVRGMEACVHVARRFEPRADDETRTPPFGAISHGTRIAQIVNWLQRSVGKGSVETENWRFSYDGTEMILTLDETQNHFLLEGVLPADSPPTDLRRMLEANFRTMLEPRYALLRGAPRVIFCHSVTEMTEPLLESALKQTATACSTYGSTYSSSDWTFLGMEDDGDA